MLPETPCCLAHSVELLLPPPFCSKLSLLDDGDLKANYFGGAWIDVIWSVKAMEKLIQRSVISYALKAVN